MSKATARCWAVLPAAGIGSRMASDIPKQYLQLGGTTLLEHSLRALLSCDKLSAVVVPLHRQDTQAFSLTILSDSRIQTVTGAQQRSGSVLAGLDCLLSQASEADWVLVHDAARPCLQTADIERLISAVIDADTGGILAEPIVETVKQADEGNRVQRTLNRDALWRAQTPQMFRLGALRDALVSAHTAKLDVTDEASAMEMAGHAVQLVPGSASNLKVTVPADLALAAWYLQGGRNGR